MQILCLITISITKGLTKMNKQYPSIIEPFITKPIFLVAKQPPTTQIWFPCHLLSTWTMAKQKEATNSNRLQWVQLQTDPNTPHHIWSVHCWHIINETSNQCKKWPPQSPEFVNELISREGFKSLSQSPPDVAFGQKWVLQCYHSKNHNQMQLKLTKLSSRIPPI
jgi:hypothetical protein